MTNSSMINLTIDGKPVQVPSGTTVWEAARTLGIEIPVLCHSPKLRPVGVCRVCVVEIAGARVLQSSCTRLCEPGMTVITDSEKVIRARRMILELLLADHPMPCEKHQRWGTCELELLAEKLGIGTPRFPSDGHPATDGSSPVIQVDHSACILCDRCIRACNEIQNNEVLGRANKSHHTRIAFDHARPMGESTCVSCGECSAACPTGALLDKPLHEIAERVYIGKSFAGRMKSVSSVCPFCGVGCPITYHVYVNSIVRVTGVEEGHTEGRLCVKGRYGFDYSLHPQRLKMPLIRRTDRYPKKPLSACFGSPEEFKNTLHSPEWNEKILEVFREATWEEALGLASKRLMDIKKEHGPSALAGFGSAKGSNEEAYLFQKIVRQIFGTNNVDHCTRLCHASSVAALMECLGSGSVSNPFQDATGADCIICIGSNAVENHPVAATYLKHAAKTGATLIVMDPRRPPLANHARHYVRFKPGTDVALLNAMMHVIIRENLVDRAFIDSRTEDFEKVRENVSRYTPKMAAKITGVPAGTIEKIALAYGRAKNAMIFWGMGISQHTTGTDNARCLIALCLMTGQIGRPHTGLHPLRGQNNVQGASDVGLIPMFFPGYQGVKTPGIREAFEKAWKTPLDPNPGLTVVEIMHEAGKGKIKGMFMMGENPILSDPNSSEVYKGLGRLEFLAVQDIFLTETAEFADVIFPGSTAAEKTGTYINTNRLIQLGNQAIEPPGRARKDLDILIDFANEMIRKQNQWNSSPLPSWKYASPEDVWNEITPLTPIFKGIKYEHIVQDKVVWGGGEVIFRESFPRGKGRFVPAEWAPARELPDETYPYVLNTGRVLYHWHTGTMTRRASVLNERSPDPYVEINPADLRALGIKNGEFVQVSSRRSKIRLRTRATSKVARGNLFIPMHFKEASANLLTIDELDPFGKIPEFKFCAVRLDRLEI